jgi:hypothetical protein
MPISARPRRLAALTIFLVVLAAIVLVASASPTKTEAASGAVAVYPSAGSNYLPPHAQIAFRNIAPSQIGSIRVTGSKSGSHDGHWVGDTDGKGASFYPNSAFTPGESVTVSTNMNIIGGHGGTFHYTVAVPGGPLPNQPFRHSLLTKGSVWHFHSRSDLTPAAVDVDRQSSRTARGYIFVAPEFGPLQDGPLIYDSYGQPVWFKPAPGTDMATVVRVQKLQRQPVLTYWQGRFGAGFGDGVDYIDDDHYHQVAAVHAGSGLYADLHAFVITPQNTALIVAEEPVYSTKAAQVHHVSRAVVFDAVAQEIDINTGNVLFQWDSLDHIPLSQSYTKFPKTFRPYDWFHMNSIDQDSDGNIVLSGRSVSAVYKINRNTGHVMWTLGGKHSSFKFLGSARFWFQHDAVVRHNNVISVFDNGAGLYNVHKQSRALWVKMNFHNHTASELGELDHSPGVLAQYEGTVQELPSSHTFVGWGQQPYFTEYDSGHHMIFDARYKAKNASFSSYRFHWNGYPQTLPAVAASNSHGKTWVYASWNGATTAKSWRVLAGSSSSSLRAVTTVKDQTFETTIPISTTSYVAVQALNSKGHVIGTSKTIRS